MTTTAKNVYKNIPFVVDVKKDRYYYQFNQYSLEKSEPINIELQPFEGLDYKISPNTIDLNTPVISANLDIDSKTLWNNEIYPGNTVTVAPKGNLYFVENLTYDNFTIRGTPYINSSGIMSNTSFSNNIYTNFYPQSNNWSIITHITTPSSFVDQAYIFGNKLSNRYTPQVCTSATGDLLIYLASSTSSWNIANGTTISQEPLLPNTEYDIELSYDGSKYQFKVNNEVTWELESDLNVYSSNSNELCFGYDSGNNAWNGLIDLSKTKILVDGYTYWSPYQITEVIREGCLESDDVSEEKTYSTFVKPDGDILLSESDKDKEGYIWANKITIPAHEKYTPETSNISISAPGITFNDGCAKTFKDGSWLNTNYIPLETVNGILPDIRCIARFKTGNNINRNSALFDFLSSITSESHTLWIGTRSNNMTIWSAGFNQPNFNPLRIDTWFWTQVIITDNRVDVYLLQSNETDFDKLPSDLSKWQIGANAGKQLKNTLKFLWLGRAASSEYWQDSIDLRSLSIDYGSATTNTWSTYWKPINHTSNYTNFGIDYKTRINETGSGVSLITGNNLLDNTTGYQGKNYQVAPVNKHYLVKLDDGYKNFFRAGDLLVLDKVATGFNTSNYLYKNIFIPENFEFYIKFVCYNNGSNQIIMSNNNTQASFVRLDSLTAQVYLHPSGMCDGSYKVDLKSAYWAKGVIKDGVYNLYIIPDNDYVDYKDADANGEHHLTITLEDITGIFKYNAMNTLIFGRNSSNWTGQYLVGLIYTDSIAFINTDTNEEIYTTKGGYEVVPGCLESGLSDVTEEKTYNSFVNNSGDLVLSTNDNIPGYKQYNNITIPAHDSLTVKPVNFEKYSDYLPTVNTEDYIASDFSNKTWFKTTVNIPSKENRSGDIVFVTRAHTIINVLQEIVISEGYGMGLSRSGNCRLYDGGAREGLTLENNQWYWFKLIFKTNDTTELYILKDDGTYTSAPIEEDVWTLGLSAGRCISNNETYLQVGGNASAIEEYWRSKIDLMNTTVYTLDNDGNYKILFDFVEK